MTKPDDYLWDRSGPVDPDVERLERMLAPLQHRAPLDEVRLRRGEGRRRARGPRIVAVTAVAAVAAAAVAIAIAIWRWPRERAPVQAPPAYACGSGASGFAFTARGGGSVACGGASVAAGVLPVGGVLDTGSHQAELAIADIGRAELDAQTRVRLDRTSPERHQLFLERGRMHARVTAPPRLFAVGTPGAHVTDLGCEYTLEIDEAGAGSITVRSGKVELESGSGRVVVVPQGAHARLLPGRRAGLPLVDVASPALAAAVVEFDEARPGAVQRVLDLATDSDAITVANLAVLASPADQRAVLVRLAELEAPPRGRTVDDALADRAVLRVWLDDVVEVAMVRAGLPWNTPGTPGQP